MRVEGLSKLMSQLKERAEKSKRDDNVSVVVGYTAAYALYVHECIEMKLKGQPRGGSVGRAARPKKDIYDRIVGKDAMGNPITMRDRLNSTFKNISRDTGTEQEILARATTPAKAPKPPHGFYWDPQGRAQAKFLETPARMYVETIRRIVINAYKQSKNLAQSLYMGGLYLQRESMQLVPVDTGNLKNSAFTRVEEQGEE